MNQVQKGSWCFILKKKTVAKEVIYNTYVFYKQTQITETYVIHILNKILPKEDCNVMSGIMIFCRVQEAAIQM
jgi:hypothetical protein